MKFVEFKKSLADKIEPVYIFYGEDRYLIDSCLKNLKSACNIELPELNLSTFDENASTDNIFTACETLPFMDKLRLVQVKDFVITEEFEAQLVKYLQNPNKSVCLAITLKDTLKNIEGATMVDCDKIDESTIQRKVVFDLKAKGFLIGNDALKTLIAFCDSNLAKIYSELDKLTAFATEKKIITNDMVQSLCVRDIGYTIFELTDALGNKQGEKSLTILDQIFKKEDATSLLGLIYSYFRRLLIASMSKSIPDSELAEDLSVKPYAITIAKKQSKFFGTKKLLLLCEKLQRIDSTIKNNFSNIENELYSFVFLAIN